jgi:hypothetical protein
MARSGGDQRMSRDQRTRSGAGPAQGHDRQQAGDADGDGGGLRAGADDVVRIMHRGVESEGRDRDKGDQVEQARDQRGLPSIFGPYRPDALKVTIPSCRRVEDSPVGLSGLQ